jgi:beta-glucanase (GH16 family)
LVRSLAPCGYGTYTWTMRMGSDDSTPNDGGGNNVSGGVSAGFTYWNNSIHEIVFEHSAHSGADNPNLPAAPESILFVNFHNIDPTTDPVESEGTVTEQPLSPEGTVYNDFMTYKFVWEPGLIRFYIDDVLFATHTTNVPVVPGLFMIQIFGRDFQFFGGPATAGTRYFYIDHVSYTPAAP